MKATLTLLVALLCMGVTATAEAQTYAAANNARRVYAIKQNQFASRARANTARRSRTFAYSRMVRGAGSTRLTGANQMSTARASNRRMISSAGQKNYRGFSSGRSFNNAYNRSTFNRQTRLRSRQIVRPALRRPSRTVTSRAFSTIR
ncbi:MAG: hypothetical protein KDD65_07090 [Bacteroidetes bacterium]|nr:hypothetical protein [Bacteroidota bacterium]